jgi:iron complex outermembrane receptor protein
MRKINLNRFLLGAVLLIYTGAPVLAGTVSELRGVVIDGSTHEPIEGAVVHLVELDKYDATDENGRFSFTAIREDKYTIEASHISYKKVTENISFETESKKEIIIHMYSAMTETSAVIVTGEHRNTRLENFAEEASSLKGKDLQRDMGLTLASTLKNETGVAIRSMGPAPARPVLRGYSGDRIAILEDGVPSNDLSATSPDHAVTLEPFTAERIEVVRGPKLLLYNTSSIGGAVSVVRNEIPDIMSNSISGNVGAFGESSNKGYLGSATLQVPVSSFMLRFEGSQKEARDQETPIGKLNNSSINTLSYSAGGSYISGPFSAGASYRIFDSGYGVPGGFIGGHPNGVDIDMFKRNINAKLKYNFNGIFLDNAEAIFSRTYYKHTEYEAKDIIGADFAIYNYEGNIFLNHKKLGPFDNGTFGLFSSYRDYKVGGYVFNPPAKSYKLSGMAYESFSLDRFDVQVSGRYNYDKIEPEREYQSKIGYIRAREYHTYSLSLSGLYGLTQSLFVGANISKSSRVPTIEELYSEGPHLAAYSYEIGNPGLKDESGIGIEGFTYYKTKDLFASFTYYYNDFSYYILPRNTGKINYAILLPEYASVGTKAMLHGFEGQAEYKPFSFLSLSVSASRTIGEFKDTGDPLPSIPPAKLRLETRYLSRSFNFGVSSEMAAKQDRTDTFEAPTAGYVIFSSYMQYIFQMGKLVNNFSFNADNIFNAEYRNHLSRVKSVMPEAGRNFRLTYRIYF